MRKLSLRTAILSATVAIAGVLVTSSPAYALIITPASPAIATGDDNSNAAIIALVLPLIAPATELYKQNNNGSEEGSLAGSYTTVFSNTPSDPSNATITWVVGQPAAGGQIYALVKDGNASPNWYLFDLNAAPLLWNGTETLEFQGFFPAQGAISHVSLFGSETNTGVPREQVPEPALLSLLGLGLATLAARVRARQ